MFHCIEFSALQDFSKRILVATNLFGRGMDIERVNIVFNYDMPEDSDTYLHRVARAGRFGTKGMIQTQCINLVVSPSRVVIVMYEISRLVTCNSFLP